MCVGPYPAGCTDASRLVIDSIPWNYMDFSVGLDSAGPRAYTRPPVA